MHATRSGGAEDAEISYGITLARWVLFVLCLGPDLIDMSPFLDPAFGMCPCSLVNAVEGTNSLTSTGPLSIPTDRCFSASAGIE